MKKFSQIIRIAILIAIIAVLSITYLLAFNFYQTQALERGNYIYTQDNVKEDQDYVWVNAAVTEIDPTKREFKLRLDFDLYGSLALSDSKIASQDVKIFVNNIAQKEFTLKKNELLSAIDIAIPMFPILPNDAQERKLTEKEKQSIRDAQVSNYPFDKYEIELIVIVTAPPAEGQTATYTTLKQIPVYFTLGTLLANYKLVNPDNNAEEGQLGMINLELQVTRAANVVFYFYFVMIVMALISLTAFAVSLTAALFPNTFELGTRLDYDIFAYMAALLFAFPALRETMPETPRLGALGDFLVFFWAEGLIALALILAVSVWLVQRYALRQRHLKELKAAQKATATPPVEITKV